MGTWAEFEEKEFETLANAELVVAQARRGRGVRLFSPGQVLEKTLAFDFATRLDPRSALYRRLFGAGPGAPGLSPQKTGAVRIPISPATRALNVFVQYKRPQYFARGHRSPVWPPNQEHLAFVVKEKGADDAARYHQVSALHRLESELGSDAMVSYACPSTWRKQELYDRFHDGSLLATSVFVPPSMLVRSGVPAYHSRWTFDPDDKQSGIPNPDGERRNSVDGEGFLDALEEGVGNSRSAEEVLVVAADRIAGLRQDVAEARRSAPRAEREANLMEDRAVRREVEELANVSAGARAFVGAAVDIALLARDLRTVWVIALDE